MGTLEALASSGAWYSRYIAEFIQSFITKARYELIVEGIVTTVETSIVAVVLGVLIGMVVALCSLSRSKILRGISKVYTDVIRGTPSVTQLLIIYYIVFASSVLPKWMIASVAFGVNSGAYVAEIIRAGIMSIDKGQTEAGRSLGMTHAQTMLHIIIPQAVKNIFPALCNEFIVLIKETAIVGYIGLRDIAKAGDQIKAATYKPFMPLVGTAVIYFVMIKILTVLFARLEKRLRKADIR